MAMLYNCEGAVLPFFEILFRDTGLEPKLELFKDPKAALIEVRILFPHSALVYGIPAYKVMMAGDNLNHLYELLPHSLSDLFAASFLFLRKYELVNPTGPIPMMVVGGYHHGSILKCSVSMGRVVTTEGDNPVLQMAHAGVEAPSSVPIVRTYFAHLFRDGHNKIRSYVLAPDGEDPSTDLIHATLNDYPELALLPSALLFSHRMFSKIMVVDGPGVSEFKHDGLGDL